MSEVKASGSDKGMEDYDKEGCDDEQIEKPLIATTTKDALVTTQLAPSETYPHRLKVSIVGVENVGIACAFAILMKRIAGQICLIDRNKDKLDAEVEDIRHAGIFLGNPLIIGTSDFSSIEDSAVVVISISDDTREEKRSLKHKFNVLKKIVPKIMKFASRAVMVVATQPNEAVSYITWKLSKLPPNRVLGTGTLLDSVRFQYYLGQRLGLANASIEGMSIGAQGDLSVPVWSGVSVAGTKLRSINQKIGENDDHEKWHEVTTSVNDSEKRLNEGKGEKGSSCWGLGFCIAEIVDAILRDTKVVLPVSTYIHSCSHGTDKDTFMSVPCVIGRLGVHRMVRLKLTEEEKNALQLSADGIHNALRECGVFEEVQSDSED